MFIIIIIIIIKMEMEAMVVWVSRREGLGATWGWKADGKGLGKGVRRRNAGYRDLEVDPPLK